MHFNIQKETSDSSMNIKKPLIASAIYCFPTFLKMTEIISCFLTYIFRNTTAKSIKLAF